MVTEGPGVGAAQQSVELEPGKLEVDVTEVTEEEEAKESSHGVVQEAEADVQCVTAWKENAIPAFAADAEVAEPRVTFAEPTQIAAEKTELEREVQEEPTVLHTAAEPVVVEVRKLTETEEPAACADPCRAPRQRKMSSFVLRSLRRTQRTLTRKRRRLEQDSLSLARELLKVKQEKSTADECLCMWTEIEVALEELAGEAQLSLPEKTEEGDSKGSGGDGLVQSLGARLSSVFSVLKSFVQNSQKAKEVLQGGLTCALSQEIFKTPMFAPDGHVYEKSMIVEWLCKKPFSPVTKQLMRPSQLIRDRTVEQAVEAWWLLKGEVRPTDESEVGEPGLTGEPGLPEVRAPTEAETNAGNEGLGLREAIAAGDEARALDLLANLSNQEVARLNSRHGDEGATVLHLALLHEMPSVALAIANNAIFRVHRARLTRSGISALQMAAALGFSDVCEAIVERCGGGLASNYVRSSVTLSFNPSRRQVLFPGQRDAADIAELYGHNEIATFLRAAVQVLLQGAH